MAVSMPDNVNDNIDLERLIQPVDLETFKSCYWEQQRLYQHLLSLAHIDHILSHSSVRASDIRIVQGGQVIPVHKPTDTGANLSAGGLEAVYQQYRSGATINLLFLH